MSTDELLEQYRAKPRIEMADGLVRPGESVESRRTLDHAERLRMIREGERTTQRFNYPPMFLRRIGGRR